MRNRNPQGERVLKRPEYTGRVGPRRDRNTQGKKALRETGVHRERGPSRDRNTRGEWAIGETGVHRESEPQERPEERAIKRPEYTGRVGSRRDRRTQGE